MDWKQLLISIRSSVDEELRLRNTYLVTENRILRQQIQGRGQLTVSERRGPAEIGQRLGKKAGALTNLGHTISAQTVGNILKRHSILPAPERKKTVTWQEFIRVHLSVLLATDFFTKQMSSWLGFVVSALLYFIQGSRRQACAVGLTLHHDTWWVLSLLSRALDVHEWMKQEGEDEQTD